MNFDNKIKNMTKEVEDFCKSYINQINVLEEEKKKWTKKDEYLKKFLNKNNFKHPDELLEFITKYKNHICKCSCMPKKEYLTEHCLSSYNIEPNGPEFFLDKNRKYFPKKLFKNETNIIELNVWYKHIDFSKYTIGTTIISAKKGWDSKTIIIGNFCENCREPTNHTDNYCNSCYKDMTGQSDRPGMGSYNGKYNKCNNCCNLFLYENKNDKYCYKCILDYCKNCNIMEEELKKHVEFHINPFLLYKINKIKNGKIKKNINITFRGKSYMFESKNKSNTKNIAKKEKKVYPISNYFKKYNRITDEVIKEHEINIKNKEEVNKCFWKKYNESKNNSKNNINNIFMNEPIIDVKDTFNEKYHGKDITFVYKNILSEIDNLEKEYKNIKIIESYYDKLNENPDIYSFFKGKSDKINKLFTDYENNRINEYKVLLEIGDLITNDKLSKQEKKEINSINQNSRPARIIKQSNRIYLLEEFINVKNIALSGISNWLRDTSDENFNLLLSLFST